MNKDIDILKEMTKDLHATIIVLADLPIFAQHVQLALAVCNLTDAATNIQKVINRYSQVPKSYERKLAHEVGDGLIAMKDKLMEPISNDND